MEPNTVTWRLHLAAPPAKVFQALSTDAGRSAFWAEESVEAHGTIRLRFSSGQCEDMACLGSWPDRRIVFRYFGSTVEFELVHDGAGGTDLRLTNSGIPAAEYQDVLAGWLNVLLPLKACLDHGVDLRNHDSSRTWKDGYVDG